ncbi:hypothetical protein [Deinococcus hohokamensis]|uniref:VCBS repeat-containing protein n=1 Tax=Deinococcus hohokamensis TaxID=309883 RepID=A0ABV9IB57_9DEIO
MSLRALCLPLALAGGLLIPGAQAQTPRAQHLTWGALRVQLTPRNEQTGQPATAVVRNGARTVLTVSGWSLAAELQPLRPGGLPELVISEFTGGAHCCQMVYLFTQDGGPVRNLGILDGGNYGVRFQDLNRDGTQEIVLGSDTLAYYDWPYVTSPSLSTVLGWDGVRLADRTRAYAFVPAQEAARNLGALLADLDRPQGGPEVQRAQLSGYYANMILAGRGAEAEAVLAREVFARSAPLRRWFEANRGALINATYAQPEGRLRVDDRSQYSAETK